MRKQDFQFDLPQSLIASQPCEERSASRLLVLNPELNMWNDRQFFELVDFLGPNDCLIFNNTKVVPARLWGQRESGGRVEILLERFGQNNSYISTDKQIGNGELFLAQLKASNTPKPGTKIKISDEFWVSVTGREGSFFKLKNLSQKPLMSLLEKYGSMPLPPYMNRQEENFDKERYQTIYAEQPGAVAAPTAGLHFDQALMDKIEHAGIAFDFVTLHVGAGTFLPMRVDEINQHQMHSEIYQVTQRVVDLVNQTRQKGGRVVAVGTTSVRCLESAFVSGELKATQGETDIFIYPGYEFKVVDALVTNFHLSESTLLMLVSAFAGKDFMLNAYQHAIESEYRFFSYGDAMFIQNRIIPNSFTPSKTS